MRGFKATKVALPSQESSEVHPRAVTVKADELRRAPAERILARDQRIAKSGEDGTAKSPKFVSSCNLMICDDELT
jgi:hypothetical protein